MKPSIIPLGRGTESACTGAHKRLVFTILATNAFIASRPANGMDGWMLKLNGPMNIIEVAIPQRVMIC